MRHWKAHYKDALRDTDIEIINTEEEYKTEPLSFTLDNITFCGSGPNDFHLADETQYDEAGRKFSLLKWGGHNLQLHISPPYYYDLQRYELEIEIPIRVFRIKDKRLMTGILFLSFQSAEHDFSKSQCRTMCDDITVYRDDVTVREFSLTIDGMCYKSVQKTLCFEIALIDICRQIKDNYYLMCCFTCQYSDYSPYGNDDYGSMLCYCRHKETYLKVNSKNDFFSFLEGKDFDMRQETYLCDAYSPRIRTGGYRGFVDGITD